jgi:hypothetical protein
MAKLGFHPLDRLEEVTQGELVVVTELYFKSNAHQLRGEIKQIGGPLEEERTDIYSVAH